jgi:oxygen-dependent protoporphyrinogen oxidase
VFVSLRGGMDRLTDALAVSAAASGAELRPAFGVRSLARDGAGAAARFADGSAARFDAVVIAAPAPVAGSLLDDGLPAASRALDAIPHGTSILVTLAYPRGHVGRRLVGHGYLVPPSEGGPIAACTWTSEKWPDRAPDDAVLCRVFVRDEDAWTSLPDEALVAAARADVERTLAITGEPRLVRVSRHEGSMPRYTVGHLGRVAAIEHAVAEWPAIVTTGASYRGVGLPDCVTQGLAAATNVRERLGGAATAIDDRPRLSPEPVSAP